MSEARFVLMGDIVEANGKTIRENNEVIGHNIPVGTLVEVKYDDWYGDGACLKAHARLWVVKQGRDCDGTPLYWLSRWKSPESAELFRDMVGGFSEKSLTIIEVTPEIVYGTGALCWPEN